MMNQYGCLIFLIDGSVNPSPSVEKDGMKGMKVGIEGLPNLDLIFLG
jgi:hypothetical protein